jgi:hypothetical protein
MRNFAGIILGASLVLGSSSGLSQDFGAKAAAAFDQGRFDEAEKIYVDAASQGTVNGHLFYNLGIAAYRQSKLGEAMAGFLAARHYLPRDPDVAANLKFVEGRIKDRLDSTRVSESNSPFKFWYKISQTFTTRELATATTTLLVLWSSIVTMALLWRRAKSLLPTVWYALIIPAISAALLLSKLNTVGNWGAITDKGSAGAKVYSGPSTRESVLFELHEGAPVMVRGAKREDFWPIELSDGRKGWIATGQMQIWL